MNDARYEAKQCEENIQPKMSFKTNLEKYAEWGKDNGKNHLDWISRCERHEASFAFRGLTCTSVGTAKIIFHALAN